MRHEGSNSSPVVVGALGAISTVFEKSIGAIGI